MGLQMPGNRAKRCLKGGGEQPERAAGKLVWVQQKVSIYFYASLLQAVVDMPGMQVPEAHCISASKATSS